MRIKNFFNYFIHILFKKEEMNMNSEKEAARKKSLGEIGELFAIKTLVYEITIRLETWMM